MAKIAQRLVAAGASPERAAAFEQQFTARAAKTGISKPRDIEDAFNQELAAAATALFPTMFRPPRADEEGFQDYIKAILGKDAYAKVQTKLKPTNEDELYALYAPDYARAVKSTAGIDKGLVKRIKAGDTLSSIVNTIRQDAKNNPSNYLAYTADDVVNYATKVYNDYVGATEDVKTALRTAEEDNAKILLGSLPPASKKFYDYQIPDPKFKYGTKTDFEAGTIDFRSNPAVMKILGTSPLRQSSATIPAPPAGGSTLSSVFRTPR